MQQRVRGISLRRGRRNALQESKQFHVARRCGLSYSTRPRQSRADHAPTALIYPFYFRFDAATGKDHAHHHFFSTEHKELHQAQLDKLRAEVEIIRAELEKK